MDPTPPCHPLHRPLLQLGRVVATPAALDALARAGQTADEFLDRHARGDWGDLDEHDRTLNDKAVAHGSDPTLCTRVLSAYMTAKGERLWIITEADRSSSCLLLPEEY
jgi:hypothetical protein